MKCQSFSHVQFFATPGTVAHQASLSMGFSRQENWSGLPSPGDLSDPGIKPGSPALQADSLPSKPSYTILFPFRWFHLNLRVKVKVKPLSRVQLFATLWTVAYQAPLSMGFSRQEYWSGLPFPSPKFIKQRLRPNNYHACYMLYTGATVNRNPSLSTICF